MKIPDLDSEFAFAFFAALFFIFVFYISISEILSIHASNLSDKSGIILTIFINFFLFFLSVKFLIKKVKK